MENSNDPPQPVGEGDHVVTAGESMVSIAAATGHFAETLWNLPENAALKEARKNGEVLLPGDRVTVIPIRPKWESRLTGAHHVFRRRGVPVKFALVLADEEGEVFAGKRYELEVDGTKLTGTSGDDGRIEAFIDPAARSGSLKVWLEEPGLPSPWIHELSLGALHPIEHPIGVQQRLANLGFYDGPLDGEATPETAAALTLFQKEQQLEPTGIADEATRKKLEELHKV